MIRGTLILAAAFFLAGCVTGAPAPITPPLSGTVLIEQPATVLTYSNANPPKGQAGATLWGPVEKLPALPTNATSGDGVLSIVIDSASIPGNIAAKNRLGTIVLGWSPAAWVRADQFRMSYDLRVTRADHSPGAVAQVVAYLNLHDNVNRTSLWLGQIAHDSRCGRTGDAGWDAGTNTPRYSVVAPNVACTLFGWRSFSFTVGQAQIAAAAAALRSRYPALKLSGDIRDYALTHANVNPEIAVPVGERARIDLDIAKWRVAKAGNER